LGGPSAVERLFEPIVTAAQAGTIHHAELWLQVNNRTAKSGQPEPSTLRSPPISAEIAIPENWMTLTPLYAHNGDWLFICYSPLVGRLERLFTGS
jgi:hypothetical protein